MTLYSTEKLQAIWERTIYLHITTTNSRAATKNNYYSSLQSKADAIIYAASISSLQYVALAPINKV